MSMMASMKWNVLFLSATVDDCTSYGPVIRVGSFSLSYICPNETVLVKCRSICPILVRWIRCYAWHRFHACFSDTNSYDGIAFDVQHHLWLWWTSVYSQRRKVGVHCVCGLWYNDVAFRSSIVTKTCRWGSGFRYRNQADLISIVGNGTETKFSTSTKLPSERYIVY